MEYQSRLTGGYLVGSKWLLWSGQIELSGDAEDSTVHVTTACSIYVFPTSNTGSRKHYLWGKIIG